MKIQDYKNGEIHKVGDFYYFVKDGKYSEDYDTISDLVRKLDGTQNNKPKNRKTTKRTKKTIKTA